MLLAGNATNQVPGSKIIDTKLYVSVVTLWTQDNVKLLKQLESGFIRTINWNKYHFNQIKPKQIFRFFNWLSFQEIGYLFYHLKLKKIKKVIQNIIFQL